MGDHEAPTKSPVLNGITYDSIKNSALVVLPAAGALYFALSVIWGFPNAEEVVGTIAAVNVFLGAITLAAKSNYKKSDAPYDGTVVVDTTNPDKDYFQLQLDTEVPVMEKQETVTFKIKNVEGLVRNPDVSGSYPAELYKDGSQ